jgi:hypothetical protein
VHVKNVRNCRITIRHHTNVGLCLLASGPVTNTMFNIPVVFTIKLVTYDKTIALRHQLQIKVRI